MVRRAPISQNGLICPADFCRLCNFAAQSKCPVRQPARTI
jgi:hypothetical protein